MVETYENHENLGTQPPLEGIVLDAEGHVLHDPKPTGYQTRDQKAWSAPKKMGIVPKVFLGLFFAALLVVGLTVAGIVLGVLFVGFLGRLFLMPKRR